VALEIARGRARKLYRINPNNPRVIDWRYNRYGARWQPFDNYPTAEAARAAILQLDKDAKQ
jgi:predicted transcriptional regulator